MLYKNEEQYKLDQKEIGAVEKYFHNKFPLRVIYPPNRVVASRLKHNKLPDKPNSISFDLKSTVKTDSGSEVWRYAENILIDEKGRKKYTPKKFYFQGVKMLDRKEIELIFFLLRKSEYRYITEDEIKESKGKLSQANNPKFMFEDLVTEAEKKVEKREVNAKIDRYLFDKDLGLSETKLREIAGGYFIRDYETLSLSQLKMHIDAEIRTRKNGADDFFSRIDDEEGNKARLALTKAMQLKVLEFIVTGKTKNWVWKTKEGTQPIFRVPPDKTPNEALYDYYLGNEGFRDDLQAVLMTRNPKAGKEKELVNTDEKTE